MHLYYFRCLDYKCWILANSDMPEGPQSTAVLMLSQHHLVFSMDCVSRSALPISTRGPQHGENYTERQDHSGSGYIQIPQTPG